jgi:hypothetical protein
VRAGSGTMGLSSSPSPRTATRAGATAAAGQTGLVAGRGTGGGAADGGFHPSVLVRGRDSSCTASSETRWHRNRSRRRATDDGGRPHCFEAGDRQRWPSPLERNMTADPGLVSGRATRAIAGSNDQCLRCGRTETSRAGSVRRGRGRNEVGWDEIKRVHGTDEGAVWRPHVQGRGQMSRRRSSMSGQSPFLGHSMTGA